MKSVEGVILAAGLSSRTAEINKLTLVVEKKPLIIHTLETMLKVCDKVTVILGNDSEVLSELINQYTISSTGETWKSEQKEIQLLQNEDYLKGMFSSVIKGLSQVSCEYAFMIPADCPFVSVETYQRMLESAFQGNHRIVVPKYEHQTGHPVLIAKSSIDKLLLMLELHPHAIRTFREFIYSESPFVQKVSDSNVLVDIDTFEAYYRVLAQHENKRFDFDDKITGRALYTGDLYEEGLYYVKTLRSSRVKAKILSIHLPNLAEFPELERDYAIITAKSIIGENYVPVVYNDWPILADTEVNYIGEPILLVVGPERLTIQTILNAIKIEYEDLPAVTSLEEVFQNRSMLDKPDLDYAYQKGDFFSAKEKAVHIFEDTFETGLQEQAYLETQSIIARYDEQMNQMIIKGSMQCPYYIKEAIEQALQIPPDQVRVIQSPTGGGFGGKEEFPSIPAVHAALAAKVIHHPVKLIYDREEDMECTTKRHPCRIKLTSYLDERYEILAQDADISMDMGAYFGLSSVVLQRLSFSVFGVYQVPNLRLRAKAYKTNHVVSGAFRGFGGPQAFFAIEMHMNHLARKLNLNPIDFKSRYFSHQGDTSSTEGVLLSPIKLEEMTDEIIQMSSFREKLNSVLYNPASNRSRKHRGIGYSVFFHGCGFTGSGEKELLKSEVRLVKYPDNTVEIFASSTEIGQGSMTTLARIVADALNIPVKQVKHTYPDTDTCPNSGPTVASRTMMIVGKILYDLAKQMKARWQESTFEVSGRYVYPPELTWDNEHFKGNAYPEYSWGVNVVEVEVDPCTYEVDVKGVWAVYDIGNPIDEKIVKGQIDGGVIQGLGYAQMEVMELQNGRVVHNTFSKYMIPSFLDCPVVQSKCIQNPYDYGPFGAKGLGELTILGVAPAYAAAVEDALDVSISKLPITPEKIRGLVHHGYSKKHNV